ncbi:hypothetical protein SAMD00023353_7900190 [Rosellinia necatrix]|uniref:Uncharacterized protein n=1 Tax=Rosellinia necatrix TaxID=77044 RepID=A0A1W2TUY6_ROSNE|nr:hypothetical protein SAMD00023353_7900190 [Rosellinia necatrix]
MQFAALLATAATLAVSANAAALRRSGARLAQFRIFGAEGCHDLNYGFYTVDESDAGNCHELSNSPTAVTSVNVEYLNLPLADGCTVQIYTDNACSEGQRDTKLNVCNNPAATGETFGSWGIVCN